VINLLAHKALMVGYGKGVRKITGQMVGAAIKDTAGVRAAGTWFFGRSPLHISALLMSFAAVLTLVALVAVAVLVRGMLR
jgi:hypothetical protein